MEGQKLRQIFLSFQEQDREVAPVHDMSSQAAGLLNQPAKVGIQFGRASGDVNLGNTRSFQCSNAFCGRLLSHHFHAIGARVDMAVAANLVAALTHIDLKDLNPRCKQRAEAIFFQQVIE